MSNTLRISNLPQGLDSSTLEEMFTRIGNVRTTQIFLESDLPAGRGFALVEMFTEAEALDCVSYFNGQSSEEHRLVVRQNTPHVPQPPPFKKPTPPAKRKVKFSK